MYLLTCTKFIVYGLYNFCLKRGFRFSYEARVVLKNAGQGVHKIGTHCKPFVATNNESMSRSLPT